MPIYAHFFGRVILTRKVGQKVGQTDLVLACDWRQSVGLYIQEYKSLCAAVTIFSTLVNIQTDRCPHTHITAF